MLKGFGIPVQTEAPFETGPQCPGEGSLCLTAWSLSSVLLFFPCKLKVSVCSPQQGNSQAVCSHLCRLASPKQSLTFAAFLLN